MSKQHMSDPSKGRYFVQVLNMADDDLGPYEMRLLVHYIRVAAKTGKCWEGVRRTSQITQMSIGMVTKTRNQLETLGYIRVKHREDDTCVIVIVDRMAENVARYTHEVIADEIDEFDAPSGMRSHDEQGVHTVEGGVHHMNTLEGSSVHVVNIRIQEPKELELEKKIKYIAPSGAADSPLLGNSDDLLLDAQEMNLLPEGKKQRTAKTKNAEKRLTQTPATTPPIPVAPALSPKSETLAYNRAIAEALGEAWGIAPTGPDYGLYIKKAKKLIEGGVYAEVFKAYCDRQKQKAGPFADKLSIANITENGRISDFIQWWAVEVENVRIREEKRLAAIEYDKQIIARNPTLDPNYVPVITDTPQRRALRESLIKLGAEIEW